jgi:peptidyl-tRNA hydrolase
VEAPDASNALAAAEVVAAMNGKPAQKLPEEVEAWLKGNKSRPDATLLDMARKAVARAKSSSELQELWAEGEEPEQWNAAVDDLAARLG